MVLEPYQKLKQFVLEIGGDERFPSVKKKKKKKSVVVSLIQSPRDLSR